MGATVGDTYKSSNITQNSHNGNTYNFVNRLHIEPQAIRVMAIRNYGIMYAISSIIVATCMFVIITFPSLIIYDTLMKNNTVFWLLSTITSVLMGAVLSIVFFENILKKVKWGHVLYKNKTIIYGLKREKFYDDIWHMELKETWNGHGRLRYFSINKTNSEPYSREITIMHYAKAKYIYDSFWNRRGREVLKR